MQSECFIPLCFWVFFCRVGVGNHIFSDLVHFHWLWEWVINTTPLPTKKSTADITHPHTTHNYTTNSIIPGSLAAAWRQRAALRRWAAWGRRQQHGSVAAATAAWLWQAAWRRWRQHGSAVAALAARWWRAAWRRQRQLGSSASAAAAVAARRRRRQQLGGCGSVVAAAVAAWWW